MKPILGCVFGKRGAGKSTYLAQVARTCQRRIVIDPTGEHDDELGRLVTVEECADVVLESLVERKPVAVRVHIQSEEDGAHVADMALALTGGLIIVDECERWIHNRGGDPAPGWVELVERGRHYGVALVLASRRPSKVWRNATASANWLVAFRTVEPNCVTYLAEYSCKAAAREVRRLTDHRYVHVDCDTDVWRVGRLDVSPPPAI